MKYALALLTHGPGPYLDRVLAAFAEHVAPAPAELFCVVDGPGRFPPAEVFGAWDGISGGAQEGFCAATRRLWDLVAREARSDYVVWLESDFEIARPVDLTELAAVLDGDEGLAQMSLMRGAVSREERRAGGLFELRRHDYVPRARWLEHTIYLTTNPSLMRHQFMVDNPWPAYDERCEGLFGIDLREAGYRFGVWGDGSVYVNHLGSRDSTGFGY